MTDYELLRLAAKAAGIIVTEQTVHNDPPYTYLEANGEPWNPLTDDGDAFRLASDLCLSVRSSALVNGDRSVMRGHAYAGDVKEAFSGNSSAMYDAARRAIVHAAAEIGKAQQ